MQCLGPPKAKGERRRAKGSRHIVWRQKSGAKMKSHLEIISIYLSVAITFFVNRLSAAIYQILFIEASFSFDCIHILKGMFLTTLFLTLIIAPLKLKLRKINTGFFIAILALLGPQIIPSGSILQNNLNLIRFSFNIPFAILSAFIFNISFKLIHNQITSETSPFSQETK